MKKSKRIFKGTNPKSSPRYNPGDLVTSSINDNNPLEVESSFWNGFDWMYYFKDSDMGLGQMWLSKIPEPIQTGCPFDEPNCFNPNEKTNLPS